MVEEKKERRPPAMQDYLAGMADHAGGRQFTNLTKPGQKTQRHQEMKSQEAMQARQLAAQQRMHAETLEHKAAALEQEALLHGNTLEHQAALHGSTLAQQAAFHGDKMSLEKQGLALQEWEAQQRWKLAYMEHDATIAAGEERGLTKQDFDYFTQTIAGDYFSGPTQGRLTVDSRIPLALQPSPYGRSEEDYGHRTLDPGDRGTTDPTAQEIGERTLTFGTKSGDPHGGSLKPLPSAQKALDELLRRATYTTGDYGTAIGYSGSYLEDLWNLQ